MIVCTTARDLARVLAPRGRACSFVPTMGALHEGHAALVRQGAALAKSRDLHDGCVVSIFVNPTQFTDASDLAKYPRTLEADLALCEAAGASIVYAPPASDVYPPEAPPAVPSLPAVATQPGLEDAFRPGHFAGVCQVVKRLFELVNPHVAVFGEKDWQQLAVIRAMTKELRLPVEVLSSPTVREPSGLAMSSRNRRLQPSDLPAALSLSQALCDAWAERTPADAERRMHHVLSEAGAVVEYAVVRDAATLLPLPAQSASMPGSTSGTPPARSLIAATVGGVRLIDNEAWRPAQ
jgi:pantoate--beta-alanine ligase